MTVLFTLIVLCGALAVAAVFLLPTGQTLLPGITVLGTNIGGLERASARTVLEELLAKPMTQSCQLVAGSQVRAVTVSDLGVRPEVDTVVRQAYALGRNGSLLTRLLTTMQVRRAGYILPPAYSMNADLLRAMLADIAQHIDAQPTDAMAHWDAATAQVVIVPSHDGVTLDVPAAATAIEQQVLTHLAAGQPLPASISLPFTVTRPHITAEALTPIDTLLGTYTTTYSTSTANRARNVETAAKAINGTVLLADEEFSFNKVVGPRTAAEGFRQAPVIINGQLRPGMGGGVCQVSTTLYNAALLANLQIVSRSHHSLPIHYAPPGQDATVAYGAIDFRFRNTTGSAIIIETITDARRLTVRILGHGPAPDVHIERSGITTRPIRVITKPDPTLPAGKRVVAKKGRAGMRVTVTRVVGGGAEVHREVLSTDTYQGEPSIIRLGTSTGSATALPPVSSTGE